MRPDGLWHPRLLHLITSLGHGDLLVVADAGLPVPPGTETVDLLWQRGDPPFLPVLAAVLHELVVEHATVAQEARDLALLDGLDRQFASITVDRVPHDRLKELTLGARAVVRTGEATPYANAVLRAGVPF
ncbi:D-ribose pyranase [Streptomyces sp. H10-C2]|uniref:D-ribose pyranase n=1 Tax=unclassified Streptomyces TaxID=2593676 RepID=UPI0024BBB0ED|nr:MULTISPECIES: D-ribose pyranase [unclassified Streptomyces]MDJ0347338.1 D-ribose pyranase [Streptomyces sp. PH10-H1]MDJ0375459.1 D-ribose pyranase [Streptomyces sp. H10-C2]